MRAMLQATGTAAVAVVLAALVGVGRAEDVKGPPSPETVLKALAEAGKPGPEHQKLQPFVGDWDLTVKMWTDPSRPPAELKGTVERRWIMGGRCVQETARGEFEGKPFDGLGLLGYDRGQKKYTATRACSLCGVVSHGLATVNASGTKFECAKEECCPLTGEKVKGRDEIVIES